MSTGSDGFPVYDRLSRRLDVVLKHGVDGPCRAESLAETLRWLCPAAELSLCYLKNGSSREIVAFDRTAVRADAAELFPLAMLELLETETAAGERCFPLPAALPMPEHRLVVEPLAAGRDSHGFVAIALSESVALEKTSAERQTLVMYAQQLALRLSLEQRETERLSLLAALGQQARFANFDDLARSVGHEFNNLLNVLTLQLAVLEQECPEHLHGELSEIRTHVRKMAAAVKELQHYRQQGRPLIRALDLNAILRSALQMANSPMRLEFAEDLPPVLGSELNVNELCVSLLKLSSEVGKSRVVSLHTQAVPGGVLLSLEAIAPASDVAESSIARGELDNCEVLARKLHGRLRSYRAGGGISAVEIELPAAPRP